MLVHQQDKLSEITFLILQTYIFAWHVPLLNNPLKNASFESRPERPPKENGAFPPSSEEERQSLSFVREDNSNSFSDNEYYGDRGCNYPDRIEIMTVFGSQEERMVERLSVSINGFRVRRYDDCGTQRTKSPKSRRAPNSTHSHPCCLRYCRILRQHLCPR